GLVPPQVRDGWHAGHEDETAATLSVPVDLGADSSATPELELFTHLETAYDLLTPGATADGGSPWDPLSGRLHAHDAVPAEVPERQITGWGARRVWHGEFPLTDGGQALTGELELRASVTTDAQVRGLGTWIGRIRVRDGDRDLLDTDRPEDAELVESDGWVRRG